MLWRAEAGSGEAAFTRLMLRSWSTQLVTGQDSQSRAAADAVTFSGLGRGCGGLRLSELSLHGELVVAGRAAFRLLVGSRCLAHAAWLMLPDAGAGRRQSSGKWQKSAFWQL